MFLILLNSLVMPVNAQLVSLLPVGIFNMLSSFIFICIILFDYVLPIDAEKPHWGSSQSRYIFVIYFNLLIFIFYSVHQNHIILFYDFLKYMYMKASTNANKIYMTV